MLKSMTAFGRADLTCPFGKFTVEINSLNRKHLDVAVSLPKELASFEVKLRQIIQENISRGKVFVKVSTVFDRNETFSVVPNLSLAKEVKLAWDNIAESLNVERDRGFSLDMLREVDNILLFSDDIQDRDECFKYLEQVVMAAIDDLIAMRIKEGGNLVKDFSKRVANLREQIVHIEKNSQHSVEKYKEKLKTILTKELPESLGLEERLLQEVLIVSEKIDIAEEICRFNSHLDQFSGVLKSKEEAMGKKLEFLILELMREINTIGAKAQSFEITTMVVDVKSELERMRQQIQNVE